MKHLPADILRPATTLEMISDVNDAIKLKLIPMSEGKDLIAQLRNGEICYPHWEDYGIKTNPNNGRAMI